MNIEDSIKLLNELIPMYANGEIEDFDHHIRLLSDASMAAVEEIRGLQKSATYYQNRLFDVEKRVGEIARQLVVTVRQELS